jgi:hypothetical protein
MFLSRTRTTLPTSDQLLAPIEIDFGTVKQSIVKERDESKNYYDRSACQEHKPIDIGCYVYAKPLPLQRGKPLTYGRVTNKENSRSYTIQTPRSLIRRNRVQIKLTAPPGTNQILTPVDNTSLITVPDNTQHNITAGTHPTNRKKTNKIRPNMRHQHQATRVLTSPNTTIF